jgi:TolB-like protein/tetratricopeptide (TPR) repeat protein
MTEDQASKPALFGRWLGRVVALGVAVWVIAWISIRVLGSGAGEGSLPPGFTITSGVDSARESGSGGPGSLDDLIAASVSREGDRFEASIAILPLVNRTGNSLYDTLGAGMTDELIARLSRNQRVKVISRQSVEELGGLGLSLAEIADTLDVDHLVVGSAFPYQDAARIQVRLIQVDGEIELWGNDFSIDQTNQIRAVEDIYDEVSTKLLEGLTPLTSGTPFGTRQSPGYSAYLAGNGHLNTRTRDGVIRAIEAFNLAIEADSSFALAYAGLSSAYALSITYRYDIGVDAYAAAGLALRAANEGVRLDPELAQVFAARGYISSVALAPAEIVLADFARARELQPNTPNVPAWNANLLVREGYYTQALAEAERAVELDPLSPARRTGLALEALPAKEYDLAIREALNARSLESEVMLPRYVQALALLLSGRAEECSQLDLGPHVGLRAICLHDLGRVEEAEAITDSLRVALLAGDQVHPNFTNVIPTGDLAAYMAWTGSPEGALPWIYRVFALSPSGIDPRVLDSGLFDSLLVNADARREVATIRDGIWTRVERELAEPAIGRGRLDR